MQIESHLKKKQRVLDNFLIPFVQSRSFPYLWLSQLISMLGGSVTTVILPMVVYSLTGSTTMMGIVTLGSAQLLLFQPNAVKKDLQTKRKKPKPRVPSFFRMLW
ncbi:MAG: transporter [Paenibacillus sp.]|jgi:hypothetical protein|nr:transporter [Paenibacillus sp.]